MTEWFHKKNGNDNWYQIIQNNCSSWKKDGYVVTGIYVPC